MMGMKMSGNDYKQTGNGDDDDDTRESDNVHLPNFLPRKFLPILRIDNIAVLVRRGLQY